MTERSARACHRTRKRAIAVSTVALVAACATSPLGRHQLMLFPEADMTRMGVAAYDKMKSETPVSTDTKASAYARCVADAVTAELGSAGTAQAWEVTVFQEDTANAFALPGAKIGIYTGLFQVARNQDQLATVVGHEVAHVIAKHSNERVSTAYATDTGLQLVSVALGSNSASQRNLYALLGLGAQVGVLLPFSRAQESEADLIGLDYMARAGFDPRQSVDLWKNMAADSHGQPPAFLSTHPGHDTRIAQLGERMPAAMKLYDTARAQGKKPNCRLD